MAKNQAQQKPTLLPCGQAQCSFGVGKMQGCKACEECGAEPNMVNERCTRCFECENKAGRLRWGDIAQEQKEELAQVICQSQ